MILRLLKITTIISLGLVLTAFVGWGIVKLVVWLGWDVYAAIIAKLAQILVIVILSATIVVLFVILGRLTDDMMPYIQIWRRPTFLESEQWMRQLAGMRADSQAMLIRRTTARQLNLSDAAFLEVFRQVLPIITKEPALSAYWAKRNDLEAIERQKRI